MSFSGDCSPPEPFALIHNDDPWPTTPQRPSGTRGSDRVVLSACLCLIESLMMFFNEMPNKIEPDLEKSAPRNYNKFPVVLVLNLRGCSSPSDGLRRIQMHLHGIIWKSHQCSSSSTKSTTGALCLPSYKRASAERFMAHKKTKLIRSVKLALRSPARRRKKEGRNQSTPRRRCCSCTWEYGADWESNRRSPSSPLLFWPCSIFSSSRLRFLCCFNC